jgi:crAss001_48 related protein
MLPHQERVFVESKELREKLMKLTAFISGNEAFGKLDAKGQSLLLEQREVMRQYLDILCERIDRF